MITEEKIIRTLEEYNKKLRSLRGQLKKQEQEYEKRSLFLQEIFDQNPELILSLFWKYYKEWLQLSE